MAPEPMNPSPAKTDTVDRLAFLEILRKEEKRLHAKSLENETAKTLCNTIGRIIRAYAAGFPANG